MGDSRIYLSRGGHVQQVTEDHTVFNELIKRGKLTREQIEKVQQKNAITRAVGVYERVEVDTLVIELIAGDVLVLASDGLHGYLESPEELHEHARARGRRGRQGARRAGQRPRRQGQHHDLVVRVGEEGAVDAARAKRLALKRDVLAKMPLFSRLTERELLRVMQSVEVREYKDGDVVIREGDKGDELFIVLDGKVRVHPRRADVCTHLGPGEHVGEMALIRSVPRSATRHRRRRGGAHRHPPRRLLRDPAQGARDRGQDALAVPRRARRSPRPDEQRAAQREARARRRGHHRRTSSRTSTSKTPAASRGAERCTRQRPPPPSLPPQERGKGDTWPLRFGGRSRASASPRAEPSRRGGENVGFSGACSLQTPSPRSRGGRAGEGGFCGGRPGAGAILALALLSGCDGCKGATKNGPRADAAPLSSRPPLHVKHKPPCVALGVTGDAGVASGSPIPETEWLTLAAGAEFTAKHPKTARETTFDGPGRARVCIGGDEESWLTGGSFRATAGVGEAPMQEQWVATPLGVLRYAQADLKLTVSDAALELEVRKGLAFVHPGAQGLTELAARSPEEGAWFGDARGDARGPPRRRDARGQGRRRRLRGRSGARPRARARDCADGGAHLGELAKEHVVSRRSARASCAVAAVLASAAAGTAREELESRVRAADADWRSLE